MIDLTGATIEIWRPKPQPDIRVMKLVRGGPLPGGCYLRTITDWHMNKDEEWVFGEHEEVWYQSAMSHFSIPWGRYVILDDSDHARGFVTWSMYEYEKVVG